MFLFPCFPLLSSLFLCSLYLHLLPLPELTFAVRNLILFFRFLIRIHLLSRCLCLCPLSCLVFLKSSHPHKQHSPIMFPFLLSLTFFVLPLPHSIQHNLIHSVSLSHLSLHLSYLPVSLLCFKGQFSISFFVCMFLPPTFFSCHHKVLAAVAPRTLCLWLLIILCGPLSL